MPIQQLREITQPVLGPQEQQLRFMQGSEELPVVDIAAASAKAPERAFEEDEQVLSIREEYYKFQADRLAKEAARRQQGTLEEWGAALQTTGTAGMVRAGFNWLERGDADPNYKLTSVELDELARTYELQLDDHTVKRLAGAYSMEHAHQLARDMQEQKLIQWKLDNAGVKSFVAQIVDPWDNALMFGAAALTGPYGGGAVAAYRVAKLAGASTRTATWTARGVHGGAQAAAAVGALKSFEVTGTETSLTDYILSIGLSAAVGAATMPSTRHLDAAIGTVKPRAGGGVDIEYGPRPDAPTPTATRIEPPAVKVDVQPSWSTPELFRRLRTASAGAAESLGAPLRRLEEGAKALSKAGVRVRVGDLADDSVRQAVQGSLQVAAQKLAAGTLPKSLRKPMQALQEAARAQQRTAEEFIAESLEAMATGSALSPTARDAINKVMGTTGNDLGQLMQASKAGGEIHAPKQTTAPVAGLADEAVADAGAATPTALDPTAPDPAAVRAAQQATDPAVQGAPVAPNAPDASAAEATSALRTATESAKSTSRWFKEFLSEYDKLTAGKEVLRNFLSRLIDDPLSRFPSTDNAASQMRINQNLANGEHLVYDTAIQEYTLQSLGQTFAGTRFGYSAEYLRRKLDIERNIQEVLVERDWLKHKGLTDAEIDAQMVGVEPQLMQLVKTFEETTAKSSDRARQQGLVGFENELSSVGYFTRIWEYNGMKALDDLHGAGTAQSLLETAIKRASPDMADLEATAIARAVIDRAKAHSTNSRSDYMGQLGKVESNNILELLAEGGTDPTIIESIQRRLQQNVSEHGAVTYSKARIPMDMRTKLELPNGETVHLLDLMDTNLSANLEAYQSSLAGRSALASIGIGGGEHGVDTFIQHYRAMVDSTGVSIRQAEAMQKQLESLLGDFTGIKPDIDTLSPIQSSLKDLSAATLLSGSGLWQVGETGVIMARKGGLNTMRHMLKNFPGIKQLAKEIGNNPELYKELEFVTGLNYTLDTRMQPFLRQREIDIGAAYNLQKYTHSAREWSSTLNGMRWVHGMQTRMLTNLNMQDMWKAANGNRRALQDALENGATPELLEAVKRVSVTDGRSLKSAGLEGLTHAEMQQYMHVITRMQDSVLLNMRAGWGASYSRSAVGQLLGQFTSYISMAHNRILRGTYHQRGTAGVAAVLAYSLPFTVLATYIQEARKGNVLDFDNDNDMLTLLEGALKYAPIAGYLGDIVSIVSGNYSSRGVAAFNVLQFPGTVTSSIGDLATGDPSQGAAGLMKAGAAVTVLGAFPGMRALIAATEGDYE